MISCKMMRPTDVESTEDIENGRKLEEKGRKIGLRGRKRPLLSKIVFVMAIFLELHFLLWPFLYKLGSFQSAILKTQWSESNG